MKNKQFSLVDFKAEGNEGEFKAVFATLGVIDKDNDVTLPGAFTDGEEVRISYWSHRWGDLPVGRGVIHTDEKEAWVDGRFFLNTQAGRETYETVKELGTLQEWSYGFEVLDASPGVFDGMDVQFLKKMKVIEVSPVMQGAGIDTRTLAIKARKAPSDISRMQGMMGTMDEMGSMMDDLRGSMQELMDDMGKSEDPPEDEAGKSGKLSGKKEGPSTLALRVAAELIEAGID